MNIFFRRWRQGVNYGVLMLACLVHGAWMRSRVKYDRIELNGSRATYRLATLGGQLRFYKTSPAESTQLVTWGTGDMVTIFEFNTNLSARPKHYDHWNGADVEWRQDWGDFHFGAGEFRNAGIRMTLYTIPYWSIAIPLTLISAYLILREQFRRKSVSVPETNQQ